MNVIRFGGLALIGMFRNVTTLVAPVAALNNYLLPIFMLLLGGALIHQAKRLELDGQT